MPPRPDFKAIRSSGAGYLRRALLFAPGLLTASIAISFLSGTLEGVGLFMLVPILGFLGIGSADGSGIAPLSALLDGLGVPKSLEALLGLFMVLMALRAGLNWLQSEASARLSNGFAVSLRTEIYEALTKARWLFLTGRRSSVFTHALTSQAEQVAHGPNLLLRLIASGLSVVAGLAVAFTLSPWLTLATLAAALMIALPMSVFNFRAYRIGQRGWKALQDIYEQLTRHFSGLKAARVLSVEPHYRSAFHKMSVLHAQASIALSRNDATASVIHSITAAAMLCSLVYIAVKAGTDSASPLLLAIIFSRLLPHFQNAQHDVQTLAAVLPQFTALDELLLEARSESDRSQPAEDLPRPAQAIDINDVSFGYRNDTAPVLDRVSLSIPARGSVGLLGTSGAGKTTLADILSGLIAQTSGALSIDGKPLTPEQLPAWRRQIAYVTQEEFLFHDSVRANLALARPGTSDGELWRALEAAHAAELVRHLPRGLDTEVGDRGSQLSRGQRQRLCLARALLANPSLLILDEATSALNPVDEREILAALKEISARTAVLVIAHRLSSVGWTDRLAVMAHGRIVEEGRLAALLEKTEGLVHAMAALERLDIPKDCPS